MSAIGTEWIGARGKTILVWIFVSILVFLIFISFLAHHAEPLFRARVIDTLSTRFQSRVELASLKVSVAQGLVVIGTGVRIYGQSDPNIHREGIQPLIGVDEFRFRVGVLSLLRSPMHIRTVYLNGLQLNIPPKEDREQFRSLAPKGGKIKIVVDEFRSEHAELVINTVRPDRLPLEFEIRDLVMKDIGPDRPLSFNATLVNPKPVGDIVSKGEFGPFHPEDPRATPVRGDYSFSHADLGTLKGIAGILSSTGRYEGELGKIVVDGQTDTPDFRLNISGRPVPLKTSFHAIVDGASGDTYLQPVHATILSTPLTATGFVVKSATPKGHHILLDVTIDGGKIEDLLRLAVRTDPPVMTGKIHLRTRLDLPAGDDDLADRLSLKGKFQLTGAHFSNDKIQEKVDALSMRSRGKPQLAKDEIPDNVLATMGSDFTLQKSVVDLPNLFFEMPGTQVTLAGDYSLDGNMFDFHGRARFDAALSKMMGGWKSVLLKPVDPFFRKNGAGTELPIKITGTKSEPHFGLDLGHKGKNEQASTSDAKTTP
ncbi:MAG: hypothetical protein HY010_11280 [Acidobacteria bacterium]|nr:hypothetical protein [Acidobacteriota bacterium]